MLKEQLNHTLEKDPRVIQARSIAEKSSTLAELIAHTHTIDHRGFALDERIVAGCYGENCPKEKPIMLLGKSPAAVEVERKLPFQGPAGQTLAHACRLGNQPLSSFYHAMATPWRPRKENTPSATQIAISRPLIQREIELVKPCRIIVLGAKAVDSLYGHHNALSEDHEHHCEWRGIEVIILRNHGYIHRNPHLLDGYAQQISRWGY